MVMTVPKEYREEIKEKERKLHKMIADGLEQVNARQIEDFDAVCERLERKYKNAGLQNNDD